MIKKYYIVAISIIAAAVVVFGVIAQAGSFDSIEFPIAELDNCESKESCKSYCNNSANADQCLAFAAAKGLMSSEEISIARKFLKKEIKGPGGCNDKESCEKYCDNMSHIDECVNFAEQNNILPPAQLQEFKQVQNAMKKGIKPPACKDKQSCELYCEEPSHMEECIQFGMEAGFLQGQELENAQKMLQAIKKGHQPPACRGREECEQYCTAPEHMESCMSFAIEAGFMTEQEKEQSQKMLNAFKRGVTPLSCKGKEACDAYCSQDEHFDECSRFAEAAGFISAEEAEASRKTRGKGPGGCRGREECEAFCKNPDNQEKCFAFAKEHGMMSQEHSQEIEEGRQKFKEGLEQAPAEALACLHEKVGPELAEKIKSGFIPPRELGEQMRECFENTRPSGNQDSEGIRQPEEQSERPDGRDLPSHPGCQTPEECEKMRMMRQNEPNPEMMNQERPEERNYMPPPMPLPSGVEQNYPMLPDRQYPQPTEQYKEPIREQYQGEIHYKGETPPLMPIPEAPKSAPGEPTGFIINTNSLVGSLLYSLFNLLFNH